MLENIINFLFRPRLWQDRRLVADAIGYLSPKFGLARPATPRVRHWTESCLATPDRNALAPVVSEPTIFLVQDSPPKTHGEEAGHYLHLIANPGYAGAFRAAKSMRECLALTNGEECIGCYAGALYARARGEYPSQTYAEWRKGKDQQLKSLGALASGDAAAHERWKDKLVGLCTHAAGYRLADELLARDPEGAILAKLARMGPVELADFTAGTPCWSEELEGIIRDYSVDCKKILLERQERYRKSRKAQGSP